MSQRLSRKRGSGRKGTIYHVGGLGRSGEDTWVLAKAAHSHVDGTEREAGRNFQYGTISGEWVQREVCGASKA